MVTVECNLALPAYGPTDLTHGAMCFFADLDERACATEEQCHAAMTAERQRAFRVINELAAGGDETLAERFTPPDELLGGSEER